MILRRLSPSDRAQAEALWRDIFRDTPAFAAYYFEKRFHPEYSFGAFRKDRLVAMALGRPTEIFVNGKVRSALLVAGVSTLPEYRKQGLMRRLMTRLTEAAKECGFACCYLHPVTETLYASLGFRNGTDAWMIRSDSKREHRPFSLKEGTDWSDMLAVYDRLLSTHNGMQLRDEGELKTVYADYATDGVKTLIVYADDRPIGYICYSDAGTVFELMALCAPAYMFLLDEAAKRLGTELKALVPTDCGVPGERMYSMQYLVFNDAFELPLHNGFCQLAY